jgi:hypothetical protein
MGKELELYFNNYFDLFATPGFKQWLDEIAEYRNDISDIRNIPDSNEFYRRKGITETLDRLLNFQAAIETAYKEQTDESNA